MLVLQNNWLVRANKRSCENKTLYAFMRSATYVVGLSLFLVIF